MTENIASNIVNAFGDFGQTTLEKSIIVFLLSMLPIMEVKGSLIAAGMINLKPIIAFFVAVIGDLIPVPFLLMFLNKFFDFLRKHNKFTKVLNFFDRKVEKNKEKIVERGAMLGLILFVGIPVPGTGAWMGSLVASLMHLDKKKSFLGIFIGVIMTSTFMMLVSYGVLNSFLYK